MKYLDDVCELDEVEREYAISGTVLKIAGIKSVPSILEPDGSVRQELTAEMNAKFRGRQLTSELAREIAQWVRENS